MVLRSVLHRTHGKLSVLARGQHNDRQARRVPANLIQRAQAGAIGQFQVEQDQPELRVSQ